MKPGIHIRYFNTSTECLIIRKRKLDNNELMQVLKISLPSKHDEIFFSFYKFNGIKLLVTKLTHVEKNKTFGCGRVIITNSSLE